MIGNINEIIGISPGTKNEEGTKAAGKTSIMTTSTGKTLKRKHDDDIVKIDSDDVCIITDDVVPEKKIVAEPKSEITITPIPKASVDKTNVKEQEPQVA